MTRVALLAVAALAPPARAEPPNAVEVALRFAHHHAAPHALTPANDRPLKVALITAMAAGKELTWDAARPFFDEAAFRKLARGDRLTLDRMDQLTRAKTPQSRTDMHAKLRLHADLLATQFDMIDEPHRKAADELAAWVAKNYRPGEPLGVIAVCTGNTRRSMLSSVMGNVAAAYYGLPDVRFYSGGTDPDAFNPRTIAALREIGVEIDPTGEDAPRGKRGGANPVYRVRWGKNLEAREFSKMYADPINPQSGFAAILVCGEADAACPKVAGASVRIAVPYLDPKAFDGAAFEAAKYAERRDDIGRFMMCVMVQARRRLELDGKLK